MAHQLVAWSLAEGLARHVPAASSDLVDVGAARWAGEKAWLLLDDVVGVPTSTPAAFAAPTTPMGINAVTSAACATIAERDPAAASGSAPRRLSTATAATAAAAAATDGKGSGKPFKGDERQGLHALGQLVLAMEALCVHSADARRVLYTCTGVGTAACGSHTSVNLSPLLLRLLPLVHSPTSPSPPDTMGSPPPPDTSLETRRSGAPQLLYPLLRLVTFLVQISDGAMLEAISTSLSGAPAIGKLLRLSRPAALSSLKRELGGSGSARVLQELVRLTAAYARRAAQWDASVQARLAGQEVRAPNLFTNLLLLATHRSPTSYRSLRIAHQHLIIMPPTSCRYASLRVVTRRYVSLRPTTVLITVPPRWPGRRCASIRSRLKRFECVSAWKRKGATRCCCSCSSTKIPHSTCWR